MRFPLFLVILFFSSGLSYGQRIWVVANIDLQETESLQVLDDIETSKEDVLIFHGNALLGNEKDISKK